MKVNGGRWMAMQCGGLSLESLRSSPPDTTRWFVFTHRYKDSHFVISDLNFNRRALAAGRRS